MQINPEVIKVLEDFNINVDEGLLYLLAIHFNLKTEIISEQTLKQVNFSKIIERDYENDKVVWNLELFLSSEKNEDAWSWIEDWRKLFMEIRSDAGGSKTACIDKMKKFFMTHPDVRKDEVIEATKLYLDEFRYDKSKVKFLQRADYFISKTVKAEGTSDRNSRLEQYIEVYRNSKKVPESSGRFKGGLM